MNRNAFSEHIDVSAKLGKKKYFVTLEGLRGAAAILVMFRHIPTYIYPVKFEMSFLAVDLFFVLSGVVIANSYEDQILNGKISFKEFAALRIMRIFPLYIFGSFIGFLSIYLDGGQSSGKLAMLIFLALFMIPSPVTGNILFPFDHPAWSLFFEFVANFVYGKFLRNITNRKILYIISTSFFVLCIGVWFSDTGLDIGWSRRTFIFGIPRVLFSFFIGVFLFRMFKSNVLSMPKLGNLSAVLILIGSILILAAPIDRQYRDFYGILAIALLLPTIVFISIYINVTGVTAKFMRVLGAISFPIYVLHAPLYSMTHSHFGNFLDSKAPVSGIIFAVLAIFFSYEFNAMVDVPIRRYLKKVYLSIARL